MRSKAQMAQMALRSVSFALMLKAIAGGAIAALALFGVTTPHIGIEPSLFGEGLAATIGGAIGAIVALRT